MWRKDVLSASLLLFSLHDITCSRRRAIALGIVEELGQLQDVMVTLIAGSLLLGIIIVALYFFGAFKSPYLGIPYFFLAVPLGPLLIDAADAGALV
jgi:hypothetical protein